MDKYKEDRQLFTKALEEAICNRFDKIIAESKMTADCSEQHKQTMDDIITSETVVRAKRISRAKLIAALVAATMLLTGCVVYALRNKIKGFIEYIYETYISMENEEDKETGYIKDVYTLSYVPEGYVLESERINYAQAYYRWENSTGEQLLFVQYPVGNFHIDVGDEYIKIIEHNGMSIYCLVSEKTYNYAWCNEDNYFSLISYVELSNDELIKILDGMVIESNSEGQK